ncbi:MAG: protoporphyrinogen oxidase [Polyangiaceae bacterium]|nr:protoporphyrinogen oxidase [Polyangiaceae bacterium]
MSAPIDVQAAVVGAGITGLAAAYELSKGTRSLLLIESRDRVGGNIRTERVDGFLIDAGPDSFVRTKPEATELCRELGLGDRLVTTQARSVFIAHRGRLVAMPAGMALAVPTRLGPILRTPLLGLGGKLRLFGDLWRRSSPPSDDETIGDFVARHFGAEAAERLAGPLLSGIYAGDVTALSIQATFPQLVELERRHKSLIFGLFAAQRARAEGEPQQALPSSRLGQLFALLGWLRRASRHAPSPFYSLRDGMQSLVDALAARLPEGAIRLGVPVTGLEAGGAGRRWTLRLKDGTCVTTDRVVLALPAHGAARLVPDPILSELLSGIVYLSTATVFVGLDRAEVQHPLKGVGFMVPHGQGRLLAATWVSSKWAGRAGEGTALVRAFIGGAREADLVDRSSDDELVALTFDELTRWMGPLGEPRLARVYRYPSSNPQPLVGHLARMERIRTRLENLEGIYLAGAAYEGVGIPDCVRQGQRAARAALGLPIGSP